MIETAMVGRDGVLSAAAALDGKVSLNKGVVQLAGSAGVMEVDQLRRLAKEFEPFREILIRHEQVLFAESQHRQVRRQHTVEARMCAAAAYARLRRRRRPVADAGVPRPNAGRAADECDCGGQPTAKSGPHRLHSRPHSPAGCRGTKEGSLRV